MRKRITYLTPEEFIRRLHHGVDWAGRWTCEWADDRTAILRKSGGTYWSGIGMRGYVPVLHAFVRLDDTGARGTTLLNDARIDAIEGRLPEHGRRQWIADAVLQDITGRVAAMRAAGWTKADFVRELGKITGV